MMLFNHTHLAISSREIYEDKEGYIKSDLQSNGAKRRLCLEIIGPTTQEENPTVNDVASCYRCCSYITNPSYNLVSGDVTLEDNPSYNILMQNN